MEYFIYVNGQNQGPYSAQRLMEMGISPDTMVWSREVNQWVKASIVPELRQMFEARMQSAEQQATGQPQYESAGQQGYQTYESGGGAGFVEFFTDDYQSEDDVPMVKRPLNKLMNLIDSGRFFREPMRWLYVLMGVMTSIGCLFAIVGLITSGAFKYKAMYGVLASVFLIVIAVFSVLFWINRSKRLKDTVQENDEIVAIPLVANFIQSVGECVGIIMGTAVAVMAFLIPLLAGNEAGYMFRDFIPFRSGEMFVVALVAPLFCIAYGFLIILMAHFWAELMLAVASIANNVKRLANKVEPTKKEEQE
jgi:uncharacterized membrane protein YciS (DUF1049 family)